MNREQVMEWAEKLAICSSASHKEFLHEGLLELVAFVAAAEREACAELMEQQHAWITNVAASALIRARSTNKETK